MNVERELPELLWMAIHAVMMRIEEGSVGWCSLSNRVSNYDYLGVEVMVCNLKCPTPYCEDFCASYHVRVDCVSRINVKDSEDDVLASVKCDESSNHIVFPVGKKISGGFPRPLTDLLARKLMMLGESPLTLDSPFLRDDRHPYATVEDSMECSHLSQELLSNFPQVVSREAFLSPKESIICRIVGVPLIAKRYGFDSTYVICDPEKVVVACRGFSIGGSTLGIICACRSMRRARNNSLSVVEARLNLVKLLKVDKVLLKESDEILFDRLGKGVYACTLALPMAQREVVEGHLLNQDVESNQATFARLNVEVFELFVPAKDRGEMECLFWKAGAVQRPLVFADALGDVRRLIVEYEGDEIVLGAVADVSRFINEDRELMHQAAPSVIKMPRDTPRLRDNLPCVESCPFYTTSRSAESIVCEPEHRFVTIEANTCSTYGRAA